MPQSPGIPRSRPPPPKIAAPRHRSWPEAVCVSSPTSLGNGRGGTGLLLQLHHSLILISRRRFMLKTRSPFRLPCRFHRFATVHTRPRTSLPSDIAMPSPPQPDLPHPAHVEKDSALGRKFGKEIVNYFGSEDVASAPRPLGLTVSRLPAQSLVLLARRLRLPGWCF